MTVAGCRIAQYPRCHVQVLSEACDLVMTKYHASKKMLTNGAHVMVNGH